MKAGSKPALLGPAPEVAIVEAEFQCIRNYLHRESGINLAADKQAMVVSRLGARLRHYALTSYDAYFRLATDGQHAAEAATMVDLLTTNETYFFREPAHFEFIGEEVCKAWVRGRPLRIWSAASSSGEEVYSLAMVLADKLGSGPWDLIGSDISGKVLDLARAGHYRLHRTQNIPAQYLAKYCLKGVRSQAGTLLMSQELRTRVQFESINLIAPLTVDIGKFDVIFLRNTLIYFDAETCRQVIQRLTSKLNRRGYFIVSHTESLQDIAKNLRLVRPSVYQLEP